MISLYFQYTHLSNQELFILRNELSSIGTISVISAKDAPFLVPGYLFGKLLCVHIDKDHVTPTFIEHLHATYPVIKLIFIKVGAFIMNPSQFFIYKPSMYVLSYNNSFHFLKVHFSSLRIFLYKLRILIISFFLKMQETFLYKYNIKYVC